jgi:hypothetical protein
MASFVLFGEEWKRQVREARTLLEDKGERITFYDTTSNMDNRTILFGLVNQANTPVLFVDGVIYNGIVSIREHIT